MSGKATVAGLVLAAAMLLYALWLGDKNVPDLIELNGNIEKSERQNEALERRNAGLRAEVADLKTGFSVVEERARMDLGLIKPGETFYQVVPETNSR